MLESAIEVQIKALDEKITLMMNEAEKRNGQRFDAQQEAVATAMVAQEKAVLAAMAAAEKAVTKAETAAEKRFESVNEFRKTLSDQTASFLTRNEYQSQHIALSEKVEIVGNRVSSLEKSMGEMRERTAGRSDVWGILVGVIAILISAGGLITVILRNG